MKEFLPLFIVYEVELDGRSFRTTAVIDWTAPISEGSLWAIQENLEKKYKVATGFDTAVTIFNFRRMEA